MLTLEAAIERVRAANASLRETSLKLITTKLRILFEHLPTQVLKVVSCDRKALYDLIDELSSVYKPNTVKSYLQALKYLALSMELEIVPEIAMEIEKIKSVFEKEGTETKIAVDQEWDERRLVDFMQWAETNSEWSVKNYRDYLILLLHAEIPLRQESRSLYLANTIFDFETLFISGKNVICLSHEPEESFIQLHMSKTSSKHNYPRVYMSPKLHSAMRKYISMVDLKPGELVFGSGEHAVLSTGSRLYQLCQRRYQNNPRGGVCNWLRRIHARRAHETKRSVEVAQQLGHSYATHAKVYLQSAFHNQNHGSTETLHST